MSCDDHDIEQWLHERKYEFKQAQLSMEAPRNAMIRARKAAAIPTEYRVGDEVKVSTDAMRCLFVVLVLFLRNCSLST